jgi:hypothetical protein
MEMIYSSVGGDTMDPIVKMRRALNERIPAGGTEANTNFTDQELQELLTDNGDNTNLAVAEGWLLKAGWVQSGDIKSYNVNGESYTFDKKEAYDLAMKQHELYSKRGRSTASVAMEVDAGEGEASYYTDLMGGKYDAE